jgi:hypothetical protein
MRYILLTCTLCDLQVQQHLKQFSRALGFTTSMRHSSFSLCDLTTTSLQTSGHTRDKTVNSMVSTHAKYSTVATNPQHTLSSFYCETNLCRT